MTRPFEELLDPEEIESGYIFLEGIPDTEGDLTDVAVTPRAFDKVVSAISKRTYGIVAYDSCSDHRQKSAKLSEQLECLRAIIPNTPKAKETTSIILDAYQYIVKLQRRVEDLSTELFKDISSAEMQDLQVEMPSLLAQEGFLQQRPLVEVIQQDGFLEVQIVCANRPGLLVDIMGALESRRLTILQAKIACHNYIVFEALTFKNEEENTTQAIVLAEGLTKKADVEEEEIVKATLVHAICQEGFDSD